MCRFTFYRGESLPLSSLITEPENSLIHQSTHARERTEPLNGDGFGVSWYVPGSHEPGLFRSINPAWSNQNLRALARVVESTCILAHVRAASEGLDVTEPNCHPFVRGRHSFMHNGELGGFRKVRRPLLATLSDPSFHAIRGTTDSELLFAVFMDELAREDRSTGCEPMSRALQRTVDRAMALVAEYAPGALSRLNLLASDGETAVACRFSNLEAVRAESLYVSHGKRYQCRNGVCRMVDDSDIGTRAALVSSEPLSDGQMWEMIPRNHYVTIDDVLQVQIRAMEEPAEVPQGRADGTFTG